MGAVVVNASWLVAKYMPDLRRREARNVGVIAIKDDQALGRFLGQADPNSQIDGRRTAGLIRSLPSYKAWVEYWTGAIEQSVSPKSIEELAACRVDDNYYLEFGGQQLFGADTDLPALLDELYSAIVEDVPAKQLSVTDLSERVLYVAGLAERVTRDVTINSSIDGTVDPLRFDYEYTNGRANLMQRISLVYPDDRSWKELHTAAWTFSHLDKVEPDANRVALVRPREENAALPSQLGVLARFAHVIDVTSDEDKAAQQLTDFIESG
jgi:hypothetical protein